MNFVPGGPANNIPALARMMAWRRPGNKPLSEPMMVNLLTHICVTWPQWVKWILIGWCTDLDPYPDRVFKYWMLFTERFCFCYPLYIFITSSAHCALVMTRMNWFTLGLWSGMLLGQHQANSWAGGDSATVKSWDQLYQKNNWTQNPRHLTIFTDISTRSQWVGLCGMVKKK